MGTRVLVVEDDPSIRTVLTYALEEEGYHVASAGDGREALARVARERPDAIVLDLQMPGLDGAGVARARPARAARRDPDARRQRRLRRAQGRGRDRGRRLPGQAVRARGPARGRRAARGR